jgi:hypothetical protein
MSNSPGESNLFLVRRLAPRGRLQFQGVAWRATIRVALAGARKCRVPGTAPQPERKRTHRVRCQGFVARRFRISLLVNSMSLRETDSLAGKARMRVHRCSVTESWPRRTPKECARLQMNGRVVVHHRLHARWPCGLKLYSTNPRSWPSINRLTAARLSFYSHPFDQYLKATH